jgi:hypothetical protein
MSTNTNTTTNKQQNVKIAYDLDRPMSRVRIGMVITGLKEIHKGLGGRLYLRWIEDKDSRECNAKQAIGWVEIASTEKDVRERAIQEVAEFVASVRNRRLVDDGNTSSGPVLHYRASANGGVELVTDRQPKQKVASDGPAPTPAPVRRGPPPAARPPVRAAPSSAVPPAPPAKSNADSAFNDDE